MCERYGQRDDDGDNELLLCDQCRLSLLTWLREDARHRLLAGLECRCARCWARTKVNELFR